MRAQKSSRPNFFILLGLHPDAVWDQANFEEVLLQKRGEWSRQSAGVAKKALAAKQNLAYLPKIYEIMNDPELREQEREAALESLRAEKTKQLEQFEKQLALINAKDTLDEEEIEHFINTFKDLLPPQDIRERITVPIHKLDASISTPESDPTLDETLIKSIEDRLHIIEMHTLYDFLQLQKTATTPEMQQKAEMLYTQQVRLSPSAEVTARIELAGLARQIFSSEDLRTQYDECLRQSSLLHLFHQLDESMKHSKEPQISQKQVLILLAEAQKVGWTEQETMEKLKEHARQKKWMIIQPTPNADAEKLHCPHCQALNDKGQRFCTTCEQALYIDCPRCGQQVFAKHKACGTCGFPVGNRQLIEDMTKELQQMLKAGDLTQAQQIAEKASANWQLGPGQQDYYTQQIAASRAQIRRMLAAQSQAHKDTQERLRQLVIYEVEKEQKREVHVEWDTPNEGTVLIIKSPQPLQQEGQTLPENQLNQLGPCLPKIYLENTAVDQWKPAEIVYYTPALLLHQQLYVGFSQRYVCVENVSQLRYQNLGSAIRLYWTWPPQSQEVRILYRSPQWPRQNDPDTITVLLDQATYHRTEYYEIEDPVHRDYYITISAILNKEGEQFFSPEARLHVQTLNKTVMTYQIKSPTRLRKKRQLCLTLASPAALPPLLLICKQGQLPFRKTDGDLFYRIEATTANKNQVVFELPDTPLPPKMFGKLFIEDDSWYHKFTVHHPGMDQMRLS